MKRKRITLRKGFILYWCFIGFLIADTNIEQIYPRFVIEKGQFIYHNHSDAEIIFINIEIQ